MASTSTTNTITNVNGFTIHRLKSGPNLPCFHDWVSMVIDEENGQIVAYGGSVRSSSEATNQFRILDVVNLSWQAPIVTGRDNFSPLPILNNASNTIFKTSTGRRFLLLFGGVDSRGLTSSKLVSIDLDSMKWGYENVKGGRVLPRVSAAMVAIKNRLFIFGGRDEISAEATLRRSYSIAEYNDNKWTWVATDVPYDSDDIHPAVYDAVVIPIYDGLKILLGPGRQRSGNTEIVNLNPNHWFVFHTRHRTFSAFRPARGTMPNEAEWYHMQPVGATTDHSRSDDVLIVAWLPYAIEDLIPEIWRCHIDNETISCMNIRSRVWDLDLDFHEVIACKGRFLLLGHDNVIYNEDGTQATGEGGQLATTLIDDALFNVIVEIDVETINSEVKVEDG